MNTLTARYATVRTSPEFVAYLRALRPAIETEKAQAYNWLEQARRSGNVVAEATAYCLVVHWWYFRSLCNAFLDVGYVEHPDWFSYAGHMVWNDSNGFISYKALKLLQNQFRRVFIAGVAPGDSNYRKLSSRRRHR